MIVEATIDLETLNNPDQWCVYSHTIGTPNPWVPHWIGYCRLPDALMAPDAADSAVWRQVVKPAHGVRLSVHSVHTRGVEAMRACLAMIRQYRPAVNGSDLPRSPGGWRRVRCVETGELFDSAADVCRKYGIHKSQMSVYLSRRDGRTIRGLRFEYA